MHTSSMIGNHQEAVVVDVEGLPVQGRMRHQCLVMQETTSLNIPLIDHGQFRLHLPGIRHHHEDLNTKKCDETLPQKLLVCATFLSDP